MNEFIKISDRQNAPAAVSEAVVKNQPQKKPASAAIRGLFDYEEHVVGRINSTRLMPSKSALATLSRIKSLSNSFCVTLVNNPPFRNGSDGGDPVCSGNRDRRVRQAFQNSTIGQRLTQIWRAAKRLLGAFDTDLG
jgi:hypothetical protein